MDLNMVSYIFPERTFDYYVVFDLFFSMEIN